MAGRGRGRGIHPIKIDIKPNIELNPVVDQSTNIDDVIDSLSKLSFDSSQKRLNEFVSAVVSYATDCEKLKHIASAIYKQSFKDPEYVSSVSKAISSIWDIDVKGSKFRSSLLSLLQSDFDVIEEIRATSESRFISFTYLLSDLCLNVRPERGKCYKIFAKAVLRCMELIMKDGSEYEMECCVFQLLRLGQDLSTECPDMMTTVMNEARRRLCTVRNSVPICCHILELIESYNSQWQPISTAASSFYSELIQNYQH